VKGKEPKRKGWMGTLAALLGAGVFLFAYPTVGPVLEALLGRATLLSAAFAMPEGTLETLRQRYAPELYEDIPDDPPPESSIHPPASSQAPESQSSGSQSQEAAPERGSSTQVELPPETPAELPEIPAQYQAPVISATMTGEAGNQAFYQYGPAWIRNYTNLSLGEIGKVLETPASVSVEASEEPQVLIYHTHTTESYEEWDREIYDSRNDWRSEDNTINMAAVGEELARELEKRGIGVIHDTTQHDYPAYNGAYDRSAATIQSYLEKYPSIKVAIDVHRDAVLYDDGSILKTVQEVNGRKAAQLMIIAPCDDGTVGIPGWKENFRFAAEFTRAVEEEYPGLMRPVFFCYRNYNLGMTPDSLLFEFGTNGNTLEEAKYTARLVGPILADYLLGETGS
jgi:stage II sporulation protein P